MIPMLKAPGTERLKLKYDELLSSIAFNFNLRRYTLESIFPDQIRVQSLVRQNKLNL